MNINALLNSLIQAIRQLTVRSTLFGRPLLSAKAQRMGALMALSVCVLLNATQAQTEFSIPTQGSDLEAEYKKELDHWMLAAYEGDMDAQFKVGVLFTNSQFSEPDYEQAVYWYKQAARQGHTLAQYNLGHQYLTGQGVSQNEKEAIGWWLKAAKQDHPLAQFNMGRAYYLGISVEQDEAQARRWFEKATANGEPKSAAILVELGWDEDLDKLLAESRRKTAEEVAAKEESQSTPDRRSEFVSRVTPAEVSPIATERSSEVVASAPNRSASTTTPATAVTPDQDSASKVDDTSRSPPEIAPSISKTEQANTQTEIQPDAKPVTPQIAESEPEVDSTKELARRDASTPVTTVDDSAKPTTQTTSNVGGEFSGPKPNLNQSSGARSVALYSNPGLRSVLIALTKDARLLKTIKRDGDWTIVTHQNGFPVWVHEDYIQLSGNIGFISGRGVNARSVPIIAKETKLERFRNRETVALLGKRKDWYRVTSPSRFKAWVKTSELSALQRNSTATETPAQTVAANTQLAESNPEPEAKELGLVNPFSAQLQREASAHHDWLFAQAPDHFTIQLASFDQPEGVGAFVNRISFADDPKLHQFEAISYNRFWVYFVYGSFTEKATAEGVKASLNQRQGLVRVFGKLQANRCLSWYLVDPNAAELAQYCSDIEYR